MKINRIFLAAIGLLCTVLVSCQKDIMKYKNDPRVYFYYIPLATTAQSYNESFSFATADSTLTQDTLFINVNIMGLAANVNRTFKAAAIDSGTTAVSGSDYKILPGTVKANQYTGLLPVIIYKTAALKTITKSLELKIIDGDDFKAGVVENNYFTLTWNDYLIEPNNWDTFVGLATFFGTYSTVKYQFIIDVTGRSQFPNQGVQPYSPNLLTNQQMENYVNECRAALAVYNSTHAIPLTDENGQLVTFPN